MYWPVLARHWLCSRQLQVPDIGEHDFEELLGGKDPLGSGGRGAVQGASSSHHAVCATHIYFASLPCYVSRQYHLVIAVLVHHGLHD